jgi:hypothetical protein
MNAFFDGFEKRAEADSLIGVMNGLASGLRSYDKAGKIRSPDAPKPGVFIAPRSDMPPIPSMDRHSAIHNLSPSLPEAQAPEVSVPKARRGR